MLLLYGGTDSASASDARVSEYRDWARGLVKSGHAVSGEELMEVDTVVALNGSEIATTPISPASANAGSDPLGGYFVVSAASEGEAMAIAKSCPHLRHGGRVVIRRVQPT